MSLLDNVAPAPRKVMTLFYVVDTSGSMCGSKIGSVNSAMEEAITSDLPEISAANDDADVIWNDLNAGGVTDLGAACKELDKKLSRNEYLNSQTGAYAPVILLFSDGGPTDNWEKELKQLKLNNWFKHAIKIAIAIGDDADKTVLAEFTGTIESVITVNDKHTLKALIRKVSVRASEFQSHSKQSGDTTSSAEDDSAKIAQDAVNEIKQDASQNSPVSGGDSGAIDVSLDQDWGNW